MICLLHGAVDFHAVRRRSPLCHRSCTESQQTSREPGSTADVWSRLTEYAWPAGSVHPRAAPRFHRCPFHQRERAPETPSCSCPPRAAWGPYGGWLVASGAWLCDLCPPTSVDRQEVPLPVRGSNCATPARVSPGAHGHPVCLVTRRAATILPWPEIPKILPGA